MSISKLVPIDVLIGEGKCIKINTDKLNPFGGYSFKLFTGERLADMIESVKRFGICYPITVRHCNDGNYEILDGHYRVVACKSIKMESVPAIIKQLNDEEALLYISDASPIGLLLKHGIDIRDYDYKKSENYQKIENARVFSDDNFSMALDEYIERLLLTEHDVYDTYESVYDMGNPYELDDEECEVSALTLAIIKTMDTLGETEIKTWEKSKERKDVIAAEVARGAQEEDAKTLVNTFTRKDGGYTEQLKTYFNLDLDLFDDNDIRNRREKAKILYFIYMLKNKYFPETNVLELLSKPSMENIDNSFLGWETSNGRFIKLIKHALEKELSSVAKDNIKRAVAQS